jgi:hypothetical protein
VKKQLIYQQEKCIVVVLVEKPGKNAVHATQWYEDCKNTSQQAIHPS